MKILKCKSCGRYTMHETCPECGDRAVSPEPATYSPQDRYGKYRRELKREKFED